MPGSSSEAALTASSSSASLAVDQTDLADALLEKIRVSKLKSIDIFLKWDTDSSGKITRSEFHKGLTALAGGEAHAPPVEQMDALFDQIDINRSGTLDPNELQKVLRAGYGEVIPERLQAGGAGEIKLKAENAIAVRKAAVRAPHQATAHSTFEYSSLAGGSGTALFRSFRGGDLVKEGTEGRKLTNLKIDLGKVAAGDDELLLRTSSSFAGSGGGDGATAGGGLLAAAPATPGSPSTADVAVARALRAELQRQAVRVIDLFRDWDLNGDGVVSRREFVRGVGVLGLPGGDGAAGLLFDSWDADLSGTLEIREINHVLRRGQEMAGAAGGRGIYPVNTTCRRNWSRRKVDGATGVVLHAPSTSPLLRSNPSLRTRPRAAPDHAAWRDAGALLSAGLGSPGGADGEHVRQPPLVSPTLRYQSSPPRSPEALFSHLACRPTEATKQRQSAFRREQRRKAELKLHAQSSGEMLADFAPDRRGYLLQQPTEAGSSGVEVTMLPVHPGLGGDTIQRIGSSPMLRGSGAEPSLVRAIKAEALTQAAGGEVMYNVSPKGKISPRPKWESSVRLGPPSNSPRPPSMDAAQLHTLLAVGGGAGAPPEAAANAAGAARRGYRPVDDPMASAGSFFGTGNVAAAVHVPAKKAEYLVREPDLAALVGARKQKPPTPRLKPGKVLVGSGDNAIFKQEKIEALLASYKRDA